MTIPTQAVGAARGKVTRGVFFAIGTICLVLVPVSVVTPLVPTGDLVVLSLFFFARSSPRFEAWLRSRPFVQRILRRYEGGLTTATKVQATAGILLSLGLSAWFFTDNSMVRTLLAFVGIYALWFVWSRPHKVAEATV